MLLKLEANTIIKDYGVGSSRVIPASTLAFQFWRLAAGKTTFTQQMGKALAATFPKGKHLHLPDARHLLMAEHPEVVNEAIADLIDSYEYKRLIESRVYGKSGSD